MTDETKTKIEIPTAPEPETTAPPKKMLEVTIDGKKVSVPEGSLLLDTMRSLGMEIPAMCYHYTFSSFGSCGICLVEVEGKSNNVRSCTAKITPNMVVRTNTEKIIDARKKAVEKHLTTHPLDCPVCDADGKCELQDMTYNLGVYDIKKGVRKQIPEDNRSVVLDFNMERCILCGQCINICKEVQEIDALAFYKKDGKTHVGAHGGVPLECEFCGDCLAVCPVGAIVSRFSKYSFKPWQLKKTETTCGYCSDGCAMTLESEGQKVVRVTSKLSYLNKFGKDAEPGDEHGGLCVRGRFGFQVHQSERRLSRPMAKIGGRGPGAGDHEEIASEASVEGEAHPASPDEGATQAPLIEWVEIPWFKAGAEIAKRLAEIKTQYGGQAIAGLIGGRCTNEEVYLFQKFMRVSLGSNNIDTAARYGHMNSVLALRRALGVGRTTTDYRKITLSDVILMIGSDITETNPVASLRVKEAKSRFGAKVLVADRARTNIMNLATHPLQTALHGEEALICGLVKAVVQKGLADPSFVQKYPAAYAALERSVAGLSEERLAAAAGLPWEKISEGAELLAKSKRGTLIWGEGIVSQKNGYQNVLRLIDLALVAGLFEKEGAGVHPVCEENNEQGAVDMGGVAEFLPGQIPFDSDADRARFAAAWRSELPRDGGTLSEILERAKRGEIKALYIVGENPIGTLPASMGAREALEKIELIIVQDPFMTETGEMADFVLPAATFAEKEGTFTNMEGKIRRVAPAFDPRGEARPDWKIFCDLSRQMGEPLQYRSVEDIHQEIAQAVPGYFKGERPAVGIERPGAERPMARYLTSDFLLEVEGRYAAPASPAPEETDGALLALTQIIYHSGKMSTRDEGLMKIYPKPTLQIGTADAEALGVKKDDVVRIKTFRGEVEAPVEVAASLPRGLVQFPEHFSAPAVKDLLEVEVDPVTHVLYFKSGTVALKKSLGFDLTVVASIERPGAERLNGGAAGEMKESAVDA